MTTDYSAFRYEVIDRVGVITLNNPAKRNPFTPALMQDLDALLPRLGQDRNLGAVILTADGEHFCAGGDINGMVDRESDPTGGRRRLYEIHRWFQQLLHLELPVITAIDGAAFGGGFSLALASDFVLLTPRAKLCCVFQRIGLVPDVGCLYTLPRIVGMQRAKEIMFTGRTLTAEECVSLGIAMSIHAPDKLQSDAMSLAKKLCEASTPAIGATKRLLSQSFQLDANAMVEMEAAAQAIFLSSDYHHDAIRRFLNKEPLRYNWDAMEKKA